PGGREPHVPPELNLLPTPDLVLYPSTVMPLDVADERAVAAVDRAMSENRMVVVVTLRPEEEVSGEELPFYSIGTVAHIPKMWRLPNGAMRLILQGVVKVRVVEILQTTPFYRARIEVMAEKEELTDTVEALSRAVLNQFQKMVSLVPYLPEELQVAAMNAEGPLQLAYLLAIILRMKTPERQQILEFDNVEDKLRKILLILNRELELLELGSKIQSQAESEMQKAQREFFLREQLKAIQRELGLVDEQQAEINELRERLEAAQLPEEPRKAADRELRRLEKLPPMAPEYHVIRTYLEMILELPWNTLTEDNLDLEHVRQVLDEDHYNLEEVKERIIEYLAVRKLREELHGPILCFVGPPGVGKTSLGQSIARALGRKFVRISLGGLHDEAEIRGHRRTYIGALPGRIIEGIRRAETRNPVFMLDEIDKVGQDFRGDPSSALLEVLDPAQNATFRDNYLDLPFDLSQVMFICTANVTQTVQPALLDRMEVLNLPGYTEEEKIHIARQHLLPRQLQEHGLTPEQLRITDQALATIIRHYTREAGVRNLEREIARVCRKVARRIAEGNTEPATVTPENLTRFLGPQKVFPEVAQRTARPGVVTGLSVTPTGGEVLFVEALQMPGKKNLILTGQLGDIMQESAQAALSYVRSRARDLGIPEDFFEKHDLHLHVPAGAIPKDGPSAGVTMATALVSALTGRPARNDLAMTGEITLSGLVLPVGGIREKVLAARRAGIKRIILPKRNENDLQEIPADLRQDLEFILVETIDEVLAAALDSRPQEETPASISAPTATS
ncbi:MAG TPA: endopeptidase La, partial [Armatimonadetes bacterium]|nr:endopeptidase La [Armatimonadota bacterium]